ncbi:hypothetical protein D9M71_476750 [compost metagenome]
MLYPLVIKDHATDAVTGVKRDPRRQGRKLSRDDRFETALGAEEHAHALIDQNQGWAVTLFGEGAHEGLAVAQRGAPVEVAQIVTGNVAAQFIEAQATATQARSMVAGENARQRLARKKAQAADAVLQCHQLAERGIDEAIRLQVRHEIRPGSRRDRAAGQALDRR